jgi:hypothetical protein
MAVAMVAVAMAVGDPPLGPGFPGISVFDA